MLAEPERKGHVRGGDLQFMSRVQKMHEDGLLNVHSYCIKQLSGVTIYLPFPLKIA